jgi:hypothetical protein
VIEGLRVAPFLYSALNGKESHNVSHMRDCDGCKATMSANERASIACGWIAPVPGSMPWHPEGLGDPPLTVCPGYTARLPQVRQAGVAFIHWEKGTLAERCGSEVSPLLLDALEVLAGSRGEFEAHRLRPKDGA